MRINIVSAIGNGLGLQKDFEMLGPLLESWGHEVVGVGLASISAPESDLTILDEVPVPRLFGKRNWVMPHPEWWFPEWDELKFDRVLAKTKDCQRLFPGSDYIGWASRDLHDPTITREEKFLHVAGGSKLKNTEAVMAAWCRFDLPPLTMVAYEYNYDNVPNATLLKRVDENELRELMNSHRYHIVPSAYEGWGHVLHEALGVGATLLTSDAPPMNEIESAVHIPVGETRAMRRATVYDVSPEAIADAVLSVKPIENIRDEFLREGQEFRRRLQALLEGA